MPSMAGIALDPKEHGRKNGRTLISEASLKILRIRAVDHVVS
jgi:hypothetical protein